MQGTRTKARKLISTTLCALAMVVSSRGDLFAQQPALTNYGMKIFRVESGLYPFVQVYARTFNEEKRPLVNLNELNVGVMVKGRSYDPTKQQYRVESLRNRGEAIRTVLIIDASASMKGKPFESTLDAANRFIDSKRPQDQVAVLAIRDTKEGYELISNFERDRAALGRRLADLKCDGQKTRLYDTIGAAMGLCAMAPQGGVRSADAEYVASCSIVVFSDGQDDGSANTREELNARITQLAIPLPIYALAYSVVDQSEFKNLEALATNSFGVYYGLGEALERMQRVVEEIQSILQSDYVVTIRSYVPIDGEDHTLRVGIEYPSKSGRFTYESAKFEALEPPPVPMLTERLKILDQRIPKLPDGNPYLASAERAPAPTAEPTPAPEGKWWK